MFNRSDSSQQSVQTEGGGNAPCPSNLALTYMVLGQGDEDMQVVDVKLQLAATSSVYDLVSLICSKWLDDARGGDGGVNGHLWYLVDVASGLRYNCPSSISLPSFDDDEDELAPSGGPPCNAVRSTLSSLTQLVGAQFQLEYDFGSTSSVKLRLVKAEVVDDATLSLCPRRVLPTAPAGFTPVQLPAGAADMDALLPNLSSVLFGEGTGNAPDLLLFQPGRKRTQAFVQNDDAKRVLQMVWAPERFGCVDELLFALDEACRRRDRSGVLSWSSQVVFPHDSTSEKYRRLLGTGNGVFRCPARSDDADLDAFARTFPRCAAAAGYGARGAGVRGWIVYSSGVLQVCRGSSATPKKTSAPEVFQVRAQFAPRDKSNVVASVAMSFESLQHLFRVAEALWAQ